jgi:hypothetical protein
MRKRIIKKRKELINHFYKGSISKLKKGSLEGKYPVTLDGGRTVIYISDKSEEDETRRNDELRKQH